MTFNSFNYLLIFLPICVITYYNLKTVNDRNFLLIIVSFYFYALSNLAWLAILVSSSTIDFYLGKKINNLNQDFDNPSFNITRLISKKKFYLILSIIFNCSLLVFFKYWNWIIESINNFSSSNFSFIKHNYDLPWAISFYTFESLSYIIDIYRKKFKASNSLIEYLTFIAFFPKLVAGPIMRSHELIPQLRQFKKKLSPRNLEFAIFLILWGVFKKIVFADNLGHILHLSKQNIEIQGAGYIIGITGIFYLYCDFSAYCDIARGSAKFLSIKLNRNFLNPLLSKNMSEFFKRWNMTLGNWIRDYVYIPLGGNKFGKLRSIFNILFTMLLFGLWHGASIQFALYGLYAGFFIIFYNLTNLDKFIIKILGNFIGNIISILIHMHIVFMGSLIFFSDNFYQFKIASLSWLSIFDAITQSNIPSDYINFNKLFYGSIIFILPIFLTDIIGYRKNREFVDLYVKFSLITKIILYVLMFYICLFFYFQGGDKFVYFQF